MQIFSNQDFQKNQIQNALLHPLGAAPSSPAVGQAYYDTSLLQVLLFNGSTWANKATDSSALSGQNAAYYLSRSNHTGTQLSATISDLATVVQAYRLDQFAAPTANLSINSKNLTNVADPVNPQDAATKNYVDTQVQSSAAGIDSKPSVRVVAVANVASLSGTTTIDGVALVAGNRVLLTSQSTGAQNGVYVVAAGAWSRALDADQTGEITPGAFWFVEEGGTYGATQWRCSNTGTVTLGSTAITIVQFGASTSYTNGNGLNLSGNSFSVAPASGGGLTVSGSGVAVDTTLVARKAAFTLGDGTSTSIALTHNLGTQDVCVRARLASTNDAVLVDWTATSTNVVTLKFAAAPAANAIKAVVIG